MVVSTLAAARSGLRQAFEFAKTAVPIATAGRPITLWSATGFPAAGSYTAILNGLLLNGPSVVGQVPFPSPNAVEIYLARLQAAGSLAGTLVLCDRIWHNGGFTITSTAVQSFDSTIGSGFPNFRDALSGGTDGVGVKLALEISASTGAGTPSISVTYTNSVGAVGRTSTNIDATVASASAGTLFRMSWDQGDVGVQSIQTLQLSATWTSGTMNLVAYREIARLELKAQNFSNAIDIVTAGRNQVFDYSVPFFYFIPATGGVAPVISGTIQWTG